MAPPPPVEMDAAQLARAWSDKLAKIARNLTDFNDSEACIRVKARTQDDVRPWRGRTAEHARQAMSALDGLWQDYLLLSKVVDEAAALVKRSNFLSNTDDKVVALLTEASVTLPSVSIPVQQRGLLDTPERQGKVAPEGVLQSMIAAFDVARSTVNSIDQAAEDISGRVAGVKSTLDAITAWSHSSGVPFGADIVLPVVDEVEADPLGAQDRLAKIEGDVSALSALQAEAKAQLDGLKQDLDDASARLAELRETVTQAKNAAKDAAEQFVGANIPLDADLDQAADELERWLATLRAMKPDQCKSARIGASKWLDFCRARAASASAATGAFAAMVAERQDLAGRLRALRAMAQTLAATRVFPDDIRALEARAKADVAKTPFDPRQSRMDVDSYEAALAAFRRTV